MTKKSARTVIQETLSRQIWIRPDFSATARAIEDALRAEGLLEPVQGRTTGMSTVKSVAIDGYDEVNAEATESLINEDFDLVLEAGERARIVARTKDRG